MRADESGKCICKKGKSKLDCDGICHQKMPKSDGPKVSCGPKNLVGQRVQDLD